MKNLALIALFATTLADAATWSGNAELGFIETGGNSDTQSLNGKFVIARKQGDLKTGLKAEALTSKENGDTSKEKYRAEGKADYSFGELGYFTTLLTYEDDRFSGYEWQSTLSVGYGYRAWASGNDKLDLEIGPGYRRNVLQVRGEVEEETVGRASLNLELNIGENAKFTEILSVEGGESNTVYKSDMGLQSTLAGALAMKISYIVKYTDKVPEDTVNTESQVGVTLVYLF
jgi:putative salt-induced outer membrane protein YdiY